MENSQKELKKERKKKNYLGNKGILEDESTLFTAILI